ncbi:MAG: aspartyl protease family protein [Parvularculaceae bacterium]|nr:aspartyl protease family protein [Parvularculaceae bacterium]
MRSTIAAAAGVLALTLAACASAPKEAPTLDVIGDRLFVDATVNGVPVSALLDSAAEVSFADKAWAAANGVATFGAETAKGTGGTAEVEFAEGVAVEALGTRLEGLTIAVLDLSDISNRIVGRKVSFILGREIFDKERLAIDIEGRSIALADRAKAPGGAALALTGERGVETFKARVNGESVNAEFDLGNGGAVLIGRPLAEKLGLLDDPLSLETRQGGGVGGEVERKVVTLKTLEFAGETFAEVEAEVDETENAGEINIGVKLLRKFRITADFGERTIWLDRR